MKAISVIKATFLYFQRTIYRKLLLAFFSTIVLIVSILVADFYFRTAGDLKQQSIETTERLTQQSSATLDSYMNIVRSYAWNYFGDANFRQFVLHMGKDPDSLSYYTSKIYQFVNDNPMISSVWINQLNGFNIRAGTTSDDITIEERARLTKIAIQQDGKGVWVPSQVFARELNAYVSTFTFVQAIKNITLSSPGPIIGVMMYGMDYDNLQKWLRDVEGKGANVTYIVQIRDGDILHSMDSNGNKQLVLSKSEMSGIRKKPVSGHFYSRDRDGSELVVYQRLSEEGWLLVSKSSSKALMKPVNDFTKRTVIIGGLSLIVSMLLASVFSSRIITPLKELSKGMKAIEAGKYSIALPVRSVDEVGYLSSSFNRMAREINRLILKVYETELVKKNAEIKSLQSQINPHFLYNTLGIIDSLSAMDGDGRVSMISRSLAKMFRYNINGDDISTLEAEIQQIRLYLSIQKIRFDSRLDYSIFLEPGLETTPIPKLLFQPLVENSILHGISGSIEGGTIRVEVMKEEGGNIQIRVWNNGVPIEQARQDWLLKQIESGSRNEAPYTERSSVGLLNVQTRIQMIYGETCGMSFHSDEQNGTTFIITILPDLSEGGSENEHHHP